MKILIVIGIVLFGIIARIAKNLMASERASDVLRETSQSDAHALSFAETLDLTVVIKKNIDINSIRDALSKIAPSFQLDNYTIKSFKEVAQDTYICLTIVKYDDLEYRRYSNENATHVLDLNFKISLDEENQTCRIYSDLHDELKDKILREEFANKLWKIIEKK
ncbi:MULTISPECIES: hypothetical protein [unclassified Arcicella]|uniref:hypothetical protein n=1 Tax=unclassified Arcicella TaxID=2644986 RepID=UPI0028610B0B|nr:MULTISPECIES: hypothetical protein [unclassified Arcicella]MDR6560494.1 hypothetical protein [Arcicella sp. BE51]MDR6809900.1 hypothetical protein [Arcicella sp. BE140]MDR6821249.1 hypothetical protein [Arcicella sp. BE139]